MAQHVIEDGQARRIAAEWHGGQSSALYSLASSGYVMLNPARQEIARELAGLDVGHARRELLALDKYLTRRTDHYPLPGWHKGWDESPVTLEQV